jgi:hypothetical protein
MHDYQEILDFLRQASIEPVHQIHVRESCIGLC